jgi:hypothetical protein
MTKRRIILLLCIVAIGALFAVWLIPQNVALLVVIENVYPGVIPANNIARNLHSDDTDLVRESLWCLASRKNPIAVSRAIELLQSPDDYIWLNAALYVGTCKRQEAVPYLIKALRHTASSSDTDTAQCLRDITGADFGTDFALWQQWWLTSHPNFSFVWESHLGHAPRLATAPKHIEGRTL